MLAHSNLVAERLAELRNSRISWRTFEISHICPDIGIQRIYHHLPICGTGDLHSSIDQTRSWLRTLPRIILTDVLCLWEEIGQGAFVELCLSNNPAFEEVFSRGIEGSVEEGEECSSFFGENLLVEVVDLAGDSDALEN